MLNNVFKRVSFSRKYIKKCKTANSCGRNQSITHVIGNISLAAAKVCDPTPYKKTCRTAE